MRGRFPRVLLGSVLAAAAAAASTTTGAPADSVHPLVELAVSTLQVDRAGDLELTASASDDVGVIGVEFLRDGAVIAGPMTAPYAHTLALTRADNDAISFAARARDAAGNTTTSAPVLVAVSIWATVQAGTPGFDDARAVAVDTAGNVLLALSVPESLDGQSHAGGVDAAVVKIDRNGVRLWTHQFGSSANDFAYGIGTDADGNIYVAGSTGGALTADPALGSTDIFVRKIDPSGGHVWTRQLGTSAVDGVNALAVDPSGGILVAAYTSGTFDSQSSSGGMDVLVLRLDLEGALDWALQFGSTDFDVPSGIAIGPWGAVHVAGVTNGDLAGTGSAGGSDAFLTQISSTGTLVWARQLGSTAYDAFNAVAVDSAGDLYAAGRTEGGIDGFTNAGLMDILIVKYDSTGTKQWTQQVGTTSGEGAYGVAVGAGDAIFVSGNVSAALHDTLPLGADDAFLMRYDAAGDRAWTRRHGSAGNELPYALAVGTGGAIFIGGATSGGLDGIVSAGSYDYFVIKYGADGDRY